jgi:hypothetical protein
LKCYTINARSRGNRSASAQVEDDSQPAAAAPSGDDEEPGPKRQRATIQDLKIEEVPGPYGNVVYVFDDEGKRFVETAAEETSRVPSGSGGDQFITDTNGIHYLCSSIPQTACPIAGISYYLKNGVGHALDAASCLLANAIKQKWPGQNNLYVITLVPSEDTRTRPAHADYKLAEKLEEKAGVTHIKGVLSQLEEIGRPAFDASFDERQRFQFAHPVEVDGTKFPNLPDGSTVFLVARSFISGAKLRSAVKELRHFFVDRPSIAIEPIAFSQTMTTRWRGPRPATLLKGDVFETLAKAEIKEWESIDGTSEENADGWAIVYDIRDPEVMQGDYRGSTATQAKTSATDSRNLVQSCEALKAKKAFDAAVCCLKIRADQHQGELKKQKKANDDFNTFFTEFLGVRGKDARVSTIIRPRAIAVCKPGQSVARLVRDVILPIEDAAIAAGKKLEASVRRRVHFWGPRSRRRACCRS